MIVLVCCCTHFWGLGISDSEGQRSFVEVDAIQTIAQRRVYARYGSGVGRFGFGLFLQIHSSIPASRPWGWHATRLQSSTLDGCNEVAPAGSMYIGSGSDSAYSDVFFRYSFEAKTSKNCRILKGSISAPLYSPRPPRLPKVPQAGTPAA